MDSKELKKYVESLVNTSLANCKITGFSREEAMSLVFKAHHSEMNKEVALKILFPLPGVDYLMARYKKILALDHPNILKVHEIGFSNEAECYYVVEEWNTGMVLSEWLKQEGACAIEDALRIVLDMAKGLAYAHAQGVVHGNLVPSNVLFFGSQPTKIMNFAFPPVWMPKSGSKAKPIMGTLGYLPPEILRGETPGFSSDIYTLATSFLELLLEKVPFPEQKSLDFGPSLVYTPPAFQVPADTPPEVVSLLQSMLSLEPEARFQKMSDLVKGLEELLRKFNKVRCPRCGKKNVPQEVFHCKECNTANLCLGHLDAQEQRCERCVQISQGKVTQKVIKPSDKNRLKLSVFLCHLSNTKKRGVLVLGTKVSVLGFVIGDSQIEICLENTSHEKLYKSFSSSVSPSGQEIALIAERVIRANMTKILEWREFAFEFYENGNADRLIPQNKTRIALSVSPEKFLNTFSQVLRIFNDISLVGGVVVEAEKQSAGFLFLEKGVLATCPAPGEKQVQVMTNPASGETLVQEVFSSGVKKIQYRAPSLFPMGRISSISSPAQAFLEFFTKETSWEILDKFTIKMDEILPATQNWDQPFGGIDPSRIADTAMQNIARFLSSSNVASPAISSLDAFLVKLAVAKEKMGETSGMLLETIGNHGVRWGDEKSAAILVEAQKLSPDMPEIPVFLARIYSARRDMKKMAACFLEAGNIYWMAQDFGLALQHYERSCQMDQEQTLPKMRLLELYEKLGQQEKIKNMGLSLLNSLRPNGGDHLDTIEKICNQLLKIDENLIVCRRELIKVCLTKNDKSGAIVHYEILLKHYTQTRDRDARVRCMATMLMLDKNRSDLEQKLENMKCKDWKSHAEKLDKYPVRTFRSMKESLPLAQLKGKMKKIIAVASVLFFLGVGGWIVAKILKPAPRPAVEKPQAEDPRIAQERELKAQWVQRHEKIVSLQKSKEWAKALELCASVRAEFEKSRISGAVGPIVQKLQSEIEKNWEEETLGVWKEAESLREMKKFEEAQGVYERIVREASDPWKKKATKSIETMKEEVEREERETKDVEKLYQRAIKKQHEGWFEEANALYDRIEKLYPQSPLLPAIQRFRKQIEGLKKVAADLFAEAENLERQKDHERAVETYQKILSSSSFKHTEVAKRVLLPILIETKPVSALCSIDGKEAASTPLVFKYPPSQFPKITVTHASFEEEKKVFSRTVAGDIWKVTLHLKYKPLWKFSTGGPIEAPLLTEGGMLFAGSRDGYLYALDVQGNKSWQFYAGLLADISGGVLTDGNNLYFGSHQGDFFAVSKNSGQQRWKFSTGSAVKSTPALCEDEICFSTENGTLWFLNLRGQKMATYELKEESTHSPSFYKKIIVAGSRRNIHALAFSSKKTFWQKPLDGNLCAGPVLHGTSLFYSSSDAKVTRLSLNGKTTWQISLPRPPTEALFVTDGQLFVGDDRGQVYGLDARDGKILWQRDTRRNPEEIAPIGAAFLGKGELLIVSNKARRLLVLSRKTGKPLLEHDLEINLSCVPGIHENKLFVGDEKGHLYAYDLSHLGK